MKFEAIKIYLKHKMMFVCLCRGIKCFAIKGFNYEAILFIWGILIIYDDKFKAQEKILKLPKNVSFH
jgi:hypothetical protein